jgi:aspartokinase
MTEAEFATEFKKLARRFSQLAGGVDVIVVAAAAAALCTEALIELYDTEDERLSALEQLIRQMRCAVCEVPKWLEERKRARSEGAKTTTD